ncbi:soluble inorganic pyrophosphatase-like [Ipomoea triloba]|uniref:soluble inorganic pyrophosphatase-like n=1 Tax=Ipomoea triloba TaxID=35885 RepID=UPI00125E168D|nr:soluble inorganic pyrophosphatase-like [Ipomoea triloba]
MVVEIRKGSKYELDKASGLIKEHVLPGTFLRARAIRLMPMIDQGERDDKNIAVCANDPEFCHYSDELMVSIFIQFHLHHLLDLQDFQNQQKMLILDFCYVIAVLFYIIVYILLY